MVPRRGLCAPKELAQNGGAVRSVSVPYGAAPRPLRFKVGSGFWDKCHADIPDTDSVLLTGLLAIGIIFIGARFIIAPLPAARRGEIESSFHINSPGYYSGAEHASTRAADDPFGNVSGGRNLAGRGAPAEAVPRGDPSQDWLPQTI